MEQALNKVAATIEALLQIPKDHDTIINYIVRCSFNDTGQRFANIVAIKLLGYDVRERLTEIEE